MMFLIKTKSLIISMFLLLVINFSFSHAQILNAPEIFQEQTQWCWAGCSQSTLAYYNTNVSQSEIADWARIQNNWGEDNCFTNPGGPICNQPNLMWGSDGSFQAILENWGVESEARSFALSQQTISAEISAGRLFEIRWGWDSGGGHFLVGRGIDGDNVYIMDPWPGNGYTIGTYDWVVSGGTHTWTHSLQLTGGIDVALVLDRSGSMGYYDYMEPAKNSASTFVGFMQPGDNVAVTSFNEQSQINYELTTIESDATITAVQNAISQIYSGGNTSIGIGIQAGQEELNKGNTQVHQGMILLSDGKENRAPWVADVLPTIPENTDIYTIALGTNSDENLLQYIASQTGGTYHFQPDTDDLQALYLFIRTQVTGEQVFVTHEGTISQGQTQQHDAQIDGSTHEATFSVTFEGSDVDLELRTPGGTLITPTYADSDPNITYTEGATYDFYRVSSPQTGQWTMIIKGVDLPTPEHYTASVFGPSDLKMDTYFEKDDYYTGEAICINAQILENGQPVTGATVTADVTAPTSSFLSRMKNSNFSASEEEAATDRYMDKTESHSPEIIQKIENRSSQTYMVDTITLYDDGSHGDGSANDGVYANYYRDTQVDGSYTFEVHASGSAPVGGQFTRESILSTFVEQAVGPTTITVTYPNGGETWTMGDVHDIYWTSDNYVGQVMIEISTTGGATWWDITEGDYTENDGKHYWRPDNASNQCLFRVTSIENPAAQDQSDDFFSIVDTGPVKQYTAVHIPDGVAVPSIDGSLNDPAWSHANPSELLNRGGTVDAYLTTWSDFSDNQVTWRAVWSAATNLLYVAIEIQDDVAGASDNDYDTIWRDDCIEFFTDGDHSGGLYSGQYATAQQWFVRRDNTIHLDDMAGPYTGSAVTTAIRYGSNGNWVLEMAVAIYNDYPSSRKVLNVNDKIGWEIWYDDSDNTQQYSGSWDRDHQVGWGYSGPAWENADDFHELIFGPKENQYTPGVYYAKKIPSNIAAPTIDGHFNESFWAMLDEDSCVFGGEPEDWNADWTRFNDNLVTWKAVWSEVTNKLYIAMKIQDDIRGDFDNSSTYSFAPWQDDCLELYTDGDNNGGYYEGGYATAQQWFLTGEGKIGIDDYPSSGLHEYSGSALKTAVSSGSNGDWFCEAELEIYNTFPSSRKTLSLGDIIGWNIWYDDSDNETTESGSYVRDHQTGWVYNGSANSNADYFGDIVLDDELQTYPTYFSDDFEDGDAIGWLPRNSDRWSVVQDEGDFSYYLNTSDYEGELDDRLGEYTIIANNNFTDFQFSCMAKASEDFNVSEAADFDIVFGYQNDYNYYYVMFNQKEDFTNIFKIVNSQRFTIATFYGSLLKDNLYHHIKIVRDGDIISVCFDGTEIMKGYDTTYSTGKIGLGSFNDSAFFDDVLITEVVVTPDKITVIDPNGGDTWSVNVPQSIHWSSTGVSGNVRIEISTNNGGAWTPIAASVPNSGSYTWTPTSTYISNQCLIKVTSLSNPAIFDQSDAVFSIVDVDRVSLAIATNHSGGQGSTVSIPINCSDVTGRFIYSGGITISYDPNVLEAVNTDISGTMLDAAGWGATTNNITSGQIAIGMAGSTPLSGSGVLVKILFQVKGSNGMTTPLQFTEAVFNEGDPPVETRDGFFQVTASNFDIQGNISYYHNASIAVADATVQLTGAATRTSTTDAGGNYEFLNLNSGNYTVTPQKTDDAKGSITPYDASMILRASVNSLTLTPYQKIAGDVSGNGDVSAYDASFILRYYVGLVTSFPVGSDWTFVPYDFQMTDSNWMTSPRHRTYTPLNADQSNQNYFGILYGDVSGNWPGAPLAGTNAQVELGIERVQKQEGGYLLIPLEVSLTDDAFSTSFKMLTNNSNLNFVSCSLIGKTEEQAVCIGNSEAQGAFIALASAVSLDQKKMTINLQFKENSAVDISSLQFDFTDIIVDDNSTTLTVVKDESKYEIPKEWKLTQNRPNPFNAETTISYQVPKPSRVTIEVYNLLGQRLRQLVDETKEPGVHQIIWNGRDENGLYVGSGIYLCKMRAGNYAAIKKMVLVQ